MGIYDREYYRGETRGSAWFSGTSPVCNAVIVINVAVFLIQNFAKAAPDGEFIGTWFAASVEETFRHYKLWQLLTATFFHGGIMHLLMNMWFFWIVAREMEPLYGSRDFLAFYLGAAIFSTLIWLLFAAASGQQLPMIGASGAVTAVATLFTLYYPKREMIFIFIPMPMWMLLTILLVHDLIPSLNGVSSAVAVECTWLVPASRCCSNSSTFDGRGWCRAGSRGRACAFSLRCHASRAGHALERPHAQQPTSADHPGLLPFPCCRRNNSMRGSTRCSPRSPARAARA